MKLIVAIPERWEDAASRVAWALARPDGTLASEGEGQIADLPAARRVTIVVPASRVLFAQVKLPRRVAQRVRNALAYAIEDQLTSAPESVHAVAAGKPLGDRQSIAVIEREWLRGVLAPFRSTGAALDSVTVETCLAPVDESEWAVVLRDDGGFVRTGAGSGFALDSALDGSVPGVLQLALDAARGVNDLPRRIVIRADSAPDTRAWERELGVACEAAGPWRAWQSLGRPSVEFLQGEFAPANGVTALWHRLRLASVLVAAALAVEVIGTLAHWGTLRYEKAQLETRMRDQFKTAFPQAQAIVDPALQMRRNLQVVRAAAGMPQESDFLPLLARAVRADSGWKVKTVGYDSGKLTLDVVFADQRQADSMLKKLQAKDADVALEAASPKGAGGEARFIVVPRAGR